MRWAIVIFLFFGVVDQSAAQPAVQHLYPWNMPAPAIAALKQIIPSQFRSFDWIYDLKGVASPYQELQSNGQTYLSGTICKPHDCHDNFMSYLIASNGSRATAKVIINDRSPLTFGYPSLVELTVLDQYIYWRTALAWPTQPEQKAVLQRLLNARGSAPTSDTVKPGANAPDFVEALIRSPMWQNKTVKIFGIAGGIFLIGILIVRSIPPEHIASRIAVSTVVSVVSGLVLYALGIKDDQLQVFTVAILGGAVVFAISVFF